jgi:predicted acyltransferase
MQVQRLASLDAYRGFVMMALVLGGYFRLWVQVKFPDNYLWQAIGRHFDHVQWQGAVFWDLIQPSFMFMVGVAIPFSYASRCARGETPIKMAGHVLYRSLILIMLSLLIVSNDQGSQRTVFDFSSGVLSQIGLAYPFAFIFVAKKPRVQLTAAAVILVGYWFAFYIYPLVPISSGYGSMNNPGGSGTFDGFYGHWNKNTNVAAAFDRWFLNLFPRAEMFRNHNAGLQTLKFIPSIVTLVFGLMAGQFLKKPLQPRLKLRKLAEPASSVFY